MQNQKSGRVRFFFSPFFLLMWRFLQSSPHQLEKYEFRAILRFLIVENRVEIALYANPPPLHGMERANPKRCKLEPERERDRHPLEARAQVPDKREREREREKRTRQPCPPSPSSWCESPKKGEKKKNHVTLPNTTNPLTRVFLLPSTTQRETLEDRPGGDPSLRYVRVPSPSPSPSNTHTHT